MFRSLVVRLAAAASVAAPALTAVAEARQEGSARPPAEWIDAYLDGSRALERGKLDVARERFEHAIDVFPRHAASLYQLACVAARQDRVDDADKLHEHTIARRLDDAAAMLSNLWVDQITSVSQECSECAFLIRAHETRISRDIGGEDSGKATFARHRYPSQPALRRPSM